MKIVAVLGSPRNNSNSSFLAEKVLEAARAEGAETVSYKLSTLNYNGCGACMQCKTKLDKCAKKDDVSQVLENIKQAQGLVLATPVYFGEVSGQFKLFFDRTYSFFQKGFVTRLSSGMRSVFITCQAQSNPAVFADIVPRYDMFLKIYGYTTKSLRATGHLDPGSVQSDTALIEQAAELGRFLVMGEF